MGILSKFKCRQGIAVHTEFEWNVLKSIIDREGYELSYFHGRKFTGKTMFFLKDSTSKFASDSVLYLAEKVIDFSEINSTEILFKEMEDDIDD